jgi:hypothetical protein
VAIPLELATVFEDHDNAKQKEYIHTNDAESCSKDEIEVDVGELGEWTNAAHFLRRGERVWAYGIYDKRWGHTIQIATAVELEVH